MPSEPALNLDASSLAACNGIATEIDSLDMSKVSSTLGLQYIIYVFLCFYAIILFMREVHQKRYLRISLSLNGVFIPLSDRTKIEAYNKHPGLISVFFRKIDNCFGRLEKWFPHLLAIIYAISLYVVQPSQQVWYIMPNISNQTAFQETYLELRNVNWCDSLLSPVKILYSEKPLSFDIFSMVQIYLFSLSVKALSESQELLYDWIDPDEFMNEENKESCSYYGIYKNRDRIFNELMLDDWIVRYVVYSVLEEICDWDKHPELSSKLTKYQMEKFTTLLSDIKAKIQFH